MTTTDSASQRSNRLLRANWMMCMSLCAHFVGYELVRAASVVLLTGLGDGSALGYTISAGFPLSAAALYAVHTLSKTFGVRNTLRISQGFNIAILALTAYFCSTLQNSDSKSPTTYAGIILFYCFREIYVGVIATQNWSFIKIPYNVLVIFAALVSVASVVGSIGVEFLVKSGGVPVLLLVAIAMQCVSGVFAELNFALEGHGSGEQPTQPEQQQQQQQLSRSKSFYVESADLMSQNATLRLLLFEAVLHQGCSNLLNQLFYDGLRRHITSDAGRAVLIGRFFAVINALSCLMQCVVVPVVMSPRRMPAFLVSVPVLVLLGTSAAFLGESLLSVMLGFGVLKVLEYSVMTSAMEMIYMPMGHEVRYLGKELIRFFGHRLGKSATSLLLSAACAYLKPTAHVLTVWTTTIAALWGASMYSLSKNLDSDVVALLEHRIRSRSLGLDPRAQDSAKAAEAAASGAVATDGGVGAGKAAAHEAGQEQSPVPVSSVVANSTSAPATAVPSLSQWLKSATAVPEAQGGVGTEEKETKKKKNKKESKDEWGDLRQEAEVEAEGAEAKEGCGGGEQVQGQGDGDVDGDADGDADRSSCSSTGSSLGNSLEPFVLVRTSSAMGNVLLRQGGRRE